MIRIETREVLAGAYRGKRIEERTLLSHAVMVDEAGRETKVLCSRVDLDNLADRFASDPKAKPTCPDCQKALRGKAVPDAGDHRGWIRVWHEDFERTLARYVSGSSAFPALDFDHLRRCASLLHYHAGAIRKGLRYP